VVRTIFNTVSSDVVYYDIGTNTWTKTTHKNQQK
jgi:hypothetical protein